MTTTTRRQRPLTMLLPSAAGRGITARTVERNETGEWSCSCPGFRFHSHCRHIRIAVAAAEESLGVPSRPERETVRAVEVSPVVGGPGDPKSQQPTNISVNVSVSVR